MTRAIALSLLVLAGCAQGAPIDGIELIDPAAEGRVGATDLETAAEAWGLDLPPGWTLVDASHDEVTAACSAVNLKSDGCTVGASRQVWVALELGSELRQAVLMHEAGHVLSGRADHVTEGCGNTHATSSHLMCMHAGLTVPTAADYDYLGEGQQ